MSWSAVQFRCQPLRKLETWVVTPSTQLKTQTTNSLNLLVEMTFKMIPAHSTLAYEHPAGFSPMFVVPSGVDTLNNSQLCREEGRCLGGGLDERENDGLLLGLPICTVSQTSGSWKG